MGQLFVGKGKPPVHAILKDLPPKELANELFGAALATALGLPVPPYFIAAATSSVLPVRKGPSRGSYKFMFATERQGTPPLKRHWTGTRIPQRLIDALARWPGNGTAFAFDTWVANVDRNLGNILFGGGTDIWLIDHGQCLTGPNWVAKNLNPSESYKNKLALWFCPYLDKPRTSVLIAACSAMPTHVKALDLTAIAQASRALDLLTESDGASMISFLRDRAPIVPHVGSRQASPYGLF
ncbi:HipA family kinase [Azospirillum sp. TSH58]|uniref:HipA family kinase n=1 Tax=Azospirillum sp. TSH58 TaxID=664962 RepID=UPI0011B1FC5D|nr:HipA family kinase [Azospirillum sp. TSH58]